MMTGFGGLGLALLPEAALTAGALVVLALDLAGIGDPGGDAAEVAERLQLRRIRRATGVAALAVVAALAYAGATKAVGCFVVAPLAFIGYKNKTWWAWTAGLALLPPLGFALWTRHAGLGSSADVYPKYWASTVQFPLLTLAQCVARFFTGGFDLLFKLNFLSLVTVGALSLLKRMRTEYKLYAVAVILLFLSKNSHPVLNEMLRYVLVIFPAFIGLALRVKRPLGLIVLSALLLLIHAVLLLKYFEWSLVA